MIMKHRYWILFCVILISLGTFGCGDDITKKYYSGGDCCDIVGDLDEPTGDDGNAVISLKGGMGEGDTAFGGYGGQLYVSSYASAGLYVKTRTLDADVTVPTPVYPEELGENGVTISTNTTVPVDPDTPAVDTPYMVSTDQFLYISDGDGDLADESPVTGLKVDAGVTLTLELNADTGTKAYLQFDDDVVIEGTVETANLPEVPDKGDLYMEVYGHFTTAAGSMIDTAGDDAASVGSEGGDAGSIEIYVYDYNGALLQGTIDASGGDGLGLGSGGSGGTVDVDPSEEYGGTLINTGTIDVSGGNGGQGGWAGEIHLDSEWAVYNTGALYANGGAATAGYGGLIYFEPDAGSLHNSGDLYCNGGDGDAGGGWAGSIQIYAGNEYAGDCINTGNLYASGGSAREFGQAGYGGFIYLEAQGGNIISTGAILGNGGDAAGPFWGGYGGQLVIQTYESTDMDYGEVVAPGLIQITGDITLNGGDGAYSGGYGGSMWVYNDNYANEMFPPVNPTELLGYTLIDVSGGDGGYGGYGGSVGVSTEESFYGYDDYTSFPAGPVVNRVDIMAVGGNHSGYGGAPWFGYGGYVELEAEGEFYSGFTVCLNSGNIDVSGGDGYGSGTGGSVWLYGHDYVENTGAITAMGGETTGGESWTGYGGYIDIASSASSLNSGDVIATGGLGTGDPAYGGYGGEFFLYGVDDVTNSGSIYCNGGDSTTYDGGNGGVVAMGSQKMVTSNSASMITVAGGSAPEGYDDGDLGGIWIDGFLVTPADGTLP
jgi:hypothetical protein